MAVLLVATFPILLLINGPVAWAALAVGSLLLYLDNREGQRTPAPHTTSARGMFRVVARNSASTAASSSPHGAASFSASTSSARVRPRLTAATGFDARTAAWTNR